MTKRTHPRKTKVLNLNASTKSEADEELPAAGTVTPILTPNGTLFRFDRHPELLQAEWQAELFESLWRILLHMRAWGRPEYTAENLGTVETENFKDILRYGTSGLFNYVESLKSAILDAGLGGRMKDDWLAFLVGGFDLAKGLSADNSASIGRMMEAMYPLMLKLRAEARVARDLLEKGAAAAQAGQPGELAGTTPQADTKVQHPRTQGAQGPDAPNTSRAMPLTEIADRVLKDPKKTRKLKSVYGDRLSKVGDKSWTILLDGLPANIRKELERA